MYVVTFDSVLWDVSEHKLLEDKLLCQEPFYMISTLVTWEFHRFILLKSLGRFIIGLRLSMFAFIFSEKHFKIFSIEDWRSAMKLCQLLAA